MSDFEILVGIDWGAANHQAALVDSDGQLLGNRSFRHDGAGLAAMTDWILARTAGAAATIGVAIEVPHGPVVEAMMERGFAVHSLNPKQLDRFRDRFSPAGAKDDSRDALTLADALRTDRRFFRRLELDTAEVVQLREWTRIANELTGERTRLVNRLIPTPPEWTLLTKVETSCDRILIAGGANVEAEWEQGPAV